MTYPLLIRSGCFDEKNMHELSLHCKDKGCPVEACGLDPDMPTPWLCDLVVPVGEEPRRM